MPTPKEERVQLFEEPERNKTPEDIRVEGLEDENDERYLAGPWPSERVGTNTLGFNLPGRCSAIFPAT